MNDNSDVVGNNGPEGQAGIDGFIDGVQFRQLRSSGDARGSFTELWRASWTDGVVRMCQANKSISRKGVLRGLHYHLRQADYWVAMEGKLQVCLLDLREGSPTFHAIMRCTLSADSPRSLFIPAGVAHGFYALEDSTLMYLVDAEYDGQDEFGVAWDDPMIVNEWPDRDPVLSDRDRANPQIAEIPYENLPQY